MFCWRVVGRAGKQTSRRFRKCLCSNADKKFNGLESIKQQIKAAGPITVAEYMKQCLQHPVFGYYMQGDVFGKGGDFITAPEVCQVFGELLAVWVLADWKSRGERLPVQLVELGPGRGTLMADILRVFQNKKLQSILEGLSVHLVEVSPAMADIQAATIQATPLTLPHFPTSTSPEETDSETGSYRSGSVAGGKVGVAWYRQLEDVPQGHSYYIAQEFFDALPIHQFQMTSSGWREVLVDIDHTQSSNTSLRFVLSPSETAASALYTSLSATHRDAQEGAWLEVCPQALLCAEQLVERVVSGGGAALIADYGGVGETKNSLRSFKNHQLHDILESPGTADITADVDFQALAKIAAKKGAGCCGPITQNEFLHKMGIRPRLEILMKSATPSQAKDFISSYEMLTSPHKMGEKFKLFSITSSPNHTPVPFFDNARLFK